MRMDRPRASRRARGHRRGRRARAASRRRSLLGRTRRRLGGPDLRGHRCRALPRQPIERPDGLCGGGRGVAARRAGRAGVRADDAGGAGWRATSCAVRSAGEMRAAMGRHAAGADAVVMAAAVADYTPGRRGRARSKRPMVPLELTLVRTHRHPRRARAGARRRARRCSSASRPRPAIRRPRAREKLRRKHVDLIVANDISRADAGFDTDTNAAMFISADGEKSSSRAERTRSRARVEDSGQRRAAPGLGRAAGVQHGREAGSPRRDE